MKRIIFHIDVNNAFLSWTAVKMLNEGSKVDIREIPSVIGGDEKARHGIVLAKSPVAKKMGIKTAISLYEARKICPKLKVFQADFYWYGECSYKLMKYLSDYSPSLEQFSIDECFMDFTGTNYLYKDYIELANKIKDEIKEKFGFTVNIGIANNKLCAKMASDFEKPDKVHTLFDDEIAKKLWPLPVGELFMVGKSTTEKLNSMNIKTIRDLANTDIKKLEKVFKNQAINLHNAAWGKDDSPVESERRKRKSISTETTLPNDENDRDKLKKILFSQSVEVGRSLRRKKMYAKTIGIIYKDLKFRRTSNQTTIDNPTNDDKEIYKVVSDLFDSTYNDEYIRLIGVKLANLQESKEKQISIFDKIEEEDDIFQETIDKINNKFGKNIVEPASLKVITDNKEEK
ncbi:MAG: DNA polymerase IV [Bacilli bacterium]|nr:DNA polymerase IV [Bacilli bacterium]